MTSVRLDGGLLQECRLWGREKAMRYIAALLLVGQVVIGSVAMADPDHHVEVAFSPRRGATAAIRR